MCAAQGPLDLLHLAEKVMNQTNSEGPLIESDGITLWVVYNGVRIAKSADWQAGIWVSLEPGYRVFYEGYPAKLVIERDGKIISQ
jgi:hypothetical protein